MNPARVIAAAVVLVATLCLGLWLGGHPEKLPSKVQGWFVSDEVLLQAEAADTIEQKYYKKVSQAQLRDASVRGMVRSLRSRFSAYLNPKENKLFRESTNGQFSGVGMTVVEVKRGLRVATLFPGSPAKQAGIKPGNLIIAVNGKSIAGEPSTVATARIKGKPGSFVTLTIVNRGKKRDVKLERETIDVPQVAGRIRRAGGQKLGAVRLASFTTGVSADLRDQLSKLQKRGAEGFVLDLRSNGGGLLEEAVLVSSIFIPDGRIVTTEGRTQPKRVYTAVGDALTKAPVVVLVDKDTASASEIVTAAMQQRYKSTVVGRRTFGKGVFGQLFPLSNGGALELTVGNYFTPNGTSINGKGIRPNVVLSKPVNANPVAALDRALELLAEQVRREDGPRPVK